MSHAVSTGLLVNPGLTAGVLTLLIAVARLVSGGLRVVVAIRERRRCNWGWVLATGALSVLLGLIILSGWPASSLWALGIFPAVDLIFQGWAWFSVGLALGWD